jgi:hypothetical protein
MPKDSPETHSQVCDRRFSSGDRFFDAILLCIRFYAVAQAQRSVF